MTRPNYDYAIGFLLVLLGIFLSAEHFALIFRGPDFEASPEFALGTFLFRIGLIVSGGYIVFLRLLPLSRSNQADAPILAEASRTETIVFVALIVCASALRFYSLNTGIWYDEMLTFVRYMPLSVGEIASTFDDANNHMLFSIFARLSLSVFGDAIWAFRLPAALFGIASIAALYFFARRVCTTTEALFSVALMTFSFHHIWFSQNARGYTLLLFCAILSSSYLLDALRTGRTRTWLLYAVAAFLGAATHLSMGLMVFAQFLIYAISSVRNRHGLGAERWNGLLYGFVPVGLLTYLSVALVLPNLLGGALLGSGLQGRDVPWANPIWAMMEVINALNVGFAGGGIVLIAGLILGIGTVHFLRTRPEVVGLFFLPTGIGFLLMTSIGYTLFPRFFFFAMGFAVVIVIHGAFTAAWVGSRLFRLSETATAWTRVAVCTGIVLSSMTSLRYVYFPKQNFAAAIEFIEAEKDPTDIVIAVGIADFPLNDFYRKGWPTIRTVSELNDIQRDGDRTWLVYTMPVHARTTYPDILERIARDYTEVRVFYGTLNGGEIVISRENDAEAS